MVSQKGGDYGEIVIAAAARVRSCAVGPNHDARLAAVVSVSIRGASAAYQPRNVDWNSPWVSHRSSETLNFAKILSHFSFS